MNVQHSSRSDLWYTPEPVLDLVDQVLGSIDFDPASDEFGNSRVRARSYLPANGTRLDLWPTGPSNIFVNPPGGKQGNESNAVLFWETLMRARDQGLLRHAIFMSFSVEHLQTTQRRGVYPMLAFPLCYPAKRIRFDSPPGPSLPKRSPSHSNVIAYIPGCVNHTQEFTRVFSVLGTVVIPTVTPGAITAIRVTAP